MNLADITTKCYILALIIRDDGERLLLGDGAYEFKDSQQHFIANTYANDVVELQGTDGQMLAGQVRRTATQTFAGYIGDATFSKQKIEEARRDFLMFFRKKHYYTAVYVFSDGTAIQRDRGYIVNAPSAPELYQRFPEWSVGLNFEDPNYYEYAEDDLGHEIAAHKVELELSTAMSGGLIWDGDGAVSDDLSYVGTEIEGEGKNFQLADTGTATLKSAELLGDAEQTTYSGKNLLENKNHTRTYLGITFTKHDDGSFTVNGTSTGNAQFYITADGVGYQPRSLVLPAGTYTINGRDSGGVKFECNYEVEGASGSRYATGTFTATAPITCGIYVNITNGTTVNNLTIYPQLEAGSTATAYEPYVGGTASPNPDYPQAVNTVTGEQTVKIEGKNLFDKDNANILNAYIDASHTSITSNSNNRIIWISCQPNTTYTIQKLTVGTSWITRQIAYTTQEPAVGVQTYDMVDMTGNDTSKSYTTGADAKYLVVRIWVSGQDTETLDAMLGSVQIELGSTATTYEPYQGQEFLIDLGSIELAKIGDYQDRIYKNDGKWYIEKQVGKVVLDGTNADITWNLTAQSGAYCFWYRNNTMGALNSRYEKICDKFTYSPLAFNNGAPTPSLCENQYGANILTIFKTDGSQGTTVADWKTWLSTHPTTVYYALATPTTTEITNSELVGQLERLRHSHTYADITNFSITATSPNLPAFLKVVAFGDDAIPQGGYVWEDGGAGGAATITVDGVDNAQPIWTVVGPATNPSLTNITTGESIQWTGVVPNGQTLVVNMADMTASLSGANVFEFISGSWITLQAGNNRVSYSATAATGIATLEWNGVVG